MRFYLLPVIALVLAISSTAFAGQGKSIKGAGVHQSTHSGVIQRRGGVHQTRKSVVIPKKATKPAKKAVKPAKRPVKRLQK